MGRMRRREAVHFGVDYFKAYIKKNVYKDCPLYWAGPGSNEITYNDTTTIILHPMMGEKDGIAKYFEVRDTVTGKPLAFILLSSGTSVGSVTRNDQYEVTGQGLILRSIQFFYNLLDWCGFFIQGFRRIDICLDINVETDYMIRNILLPGLERKSDEQKKKAKEEGKDARCRKYKPYVGSKGEYETLDIGERKKMNTWTFIRVYNKWLDTTKKKKWGLYDEDVITKDTTRIEVELREDKCEGIKDYDLLDNENLFGVFRRCVFGLNFQFFKFIHEEGCCKLIESHIKEVFDGVEDWNPSKGKKAEKMKELLDRQEKLGTWFVSTTDKDRAISMLRNTYKKLRSNGFEMQALFEMLVKVEETEIENHKKTHNLSVL